MDSGCLTNRAARTAPLRVTRRKMVADIAFGNCPKDSVRQRMHGNICIAMACKALVMGYLDAAKP